MSQIARDLARRLAAAGVDASVLAASRKRHGVGARGGDQSRRAASPDRYLLEAYGPSEIESSALGNRRQEERP